MNSKNAVLVATGLVALVGSAAWGWVMWTLVLAEEFTLLVPGLLVSLCMVLSVCGAYWVKLDVEDSWKDRVREVEELCTKQIRDHSEETGSIALALSEILAILHLGNEEKRDPVVNNVRKLLAWQLILVVGKKRFVEVDDFKAQVGSTSDPEPLLKLPQRAYNDVVHLHFEEINNDDTFSSDLRDTLFKQAGIVAAQR